MNTEYQNTCYKNMTLFKNRILCVALYYTIMLNLICDTQQHIVYTKINLYAI